MQIMINNCQFVNQQLKLESSGEAVNHQSQMYSFENVQQVDKLEDIVP